MGVGKWCVDVSTQDQAELQSWPRSQTIARALAVRAQIVLGSAQGESIRELAERLDVSQPTNRSAIGLTVIGRKALRDLKPNRAVGGVGA